MKRPADAVLTLAIVLFFVVPPYLRSRQIAAEALTNLKGKDPEQ